MKCYLVEPKTRSESGAVLDWHRPDTGETHQHLKDFGPGAMWNAYWYLGIGRSNGDYGRGDHAPFFDGKGGPDGRFMCVRLPNGHDWLIDSRASNCTMKDDDAHRCWIRHGEPPNLSVDKQGVTCQAGGGSIQGGNWHGYLRNGELVQ